MLLLTRMVPALLLYAAVPALYGQSYKVALSSPNRPATVHIEVPAQVLVEEHNGKEVLIRAEGQPAAPARAAMKPVYNNVSDNTGLGLAVKESGNTVEITGLVRGTGVSYRIQVPAGAFLRIRSDERTGKSIEVRKATGEIEVDSKYSDLRLTDVSGSLTANTLYAKVQVVFARLGPSKQVSISSLYGSVDVRVPPGTPAAVRLTSHYGRVHTDVPVQGASPAANPRRIAGAVRGGGAGIQLESANGDVSLREQ